MIDRIITNNVDRKMMEPFTAIYTNKEIIVPTQSEADSLYQDGYGVRRNKVHYLSSVETLYNVERKKLNVIDEDTNQTLNFQQLLHYLSEEDHSIWTNFIVYKDLRTRGFIIEIKKHNFRIYDRGDFGKKPATYQLKIISEGKPETIKTLLESVEKDPLSMKVAVVDRRGEIVYYGLKKKEF